MNYKKPSSKSWASSFFRNQLKKLQSFTEDEPITAERRVQDFIGMLLQKIQHPDVRFCPLEFDRFQAAMALPPSSDCSGAVLYLHGGGYCCGGLIFSVCLAAKKLGLPLPAGLVAISPWTDLTASGKSYVENESMDPSISLRRLQFFASCYTDEPENPLASPLFGDLLNFPESLLFVGGDEIMRDDAVKLHQKLLASGCKSTLTVAPNMWHVYVLYGVKDRRQDMDAIQKFIQRVAQ